MAIQPLGSRMVCTKCGMIGPTLAPIGAARQQAACVSGAIVTDNQDLPWLTFTMIVHTVRSTLLESVEMGGWDA